MATTQLQHPSQTRPQHGRKLLGPGDQVTWTDPDRGLCSRTLTIQRIEYRPGGTVQITVSVMQSPSCAAPPVVALLCNEPASSGGVGKVVRFGFRAGAEWSKRGDVLS